jgi:hypothetical protein
MRFFNSAATARLCGPFLSAEGASLPRRGENIPNAKKIPNARKRSGISLKKLDPDEAKRLIEVK